MSNALKTACRINRWVWVVLLCGCLASFGCQRQSPDRGDRSLDDILRTGELIMLTRNNAHCFYYYRDEAMGFEYDLVKAFTEEIGVRLAVKIADRWEQMIPALLSGQGHLLDASGLQPSRRGISTPINTLSFIATTPP